ncbi:MAG TPA: CRISPR-associated endonuclease Cas2 [Candidatus Competibacteraceae bacterium]|nr:CRISPR-associated endonuclease Cas2 [Candidatus Competibacteraceae bacterium]
MSRAQLYLICYDIADPQRLARVARYLERRACRVQYSVFAAQTRPERLARWLEELKVLIEPRVDDIRAYPLPAAADVALLGGQLFPDDILLIRDGHNLLRLSPTAWRQRH